MRSLLFLALVACGSPTKAPAPVQAPAPAGPSSPTDPAVVPSEAAAVPEAPGRTPRYDARTFFDTISMFGASFSHDGARILVSSNATGVFNVYAQPVAGGAPVQLTKSTTDSNFAISYFPGDDRYLYSVDGGGNELTHIWVAEKDGTAKDLTPGEKAKAMFRGWSKDRKSFYIATNEREPKFFDLYRYATDGYARTIVFQNDAGFQLGDVSPDGKWLSLTKVINNADTNVYIADLAAKKKAEPKLITKHTGTVENRARGFTPDNKKLIYTTDGEGEFAQAWSYDLKSGKRAVEAKASWDVNDVGFSENGKYRVVVTNEDARSVLKVTTKKGDEVAAKELPAGDIVDVEFDRAEKQMALYLSSDRTPADLYVIDLGTGASKRLSSNLNPKVNPEHLVQTTVVRYKSFDGLEIPALLYKPLDAAPDARVPAVVWVHGGPGGQSRIGYSALLQYLVNHGYAVLAVNNRGSSGYGKTFFHMDDKKHGDVDLKDCVFARTYLATLDWVDGSRVAIMGGSYGGYMTVAALAFEPDAFDAGVDIFGVTNWVRTLESIPPWWAAMRDGLYAEMGDPATDKERLTARSPLFHAKNIKKPLLVIQGANDPRVLKVESDEIVAAVKKNGVPVEYLVFDDEGHGFQKRKNNIAAAEKYVAFFNRYLKGRR
jgi:prolyl oligopeptidase